MPGSSEPPNDAALQTELDALARSKWVNLGMGLAGVGTAWISHSDAILVDGLFSMIGFVSAIFGARVAISLRRPSNVERPLGYAADEVIFAMFRSLALLVLVLASMTNAVLNIFDYAAGGRPAELVYSAILIYLVSVSATCLMLARSHRKAWKATGSNSAILDLEAKAATFDGLVTLAAGVGLLAFPLISQTQFGWLSPIGDSLVVLLLCTFAVVGYWGSFREHLSDLSITSTKGEDANLISAKVKATIGPNFGVVHKIDILKLGRIHQVLIHFAPTEPIDGLHVDRLVDATISGLKDAGYNCQVAILVSAVEKT